MCVAGGEMVEYVFVYVCVCVRKSVCVCVCCHRSGMWMCVYLEVCKSSL